MLTPEQWALVQQHLPLIQSTAKRLIQKQQLQQDMYDVGLDALIYSASKYRKDVGLGSFRNYAISGLRMRMVSRLSTMLHEKRRMAKAIDQWKREKLKAADQRKRDDSVFMVTDVLKQLPIEDRRRLLRKYGIPIPGEWVKRPPQPKKGPKNPYTPVQWATHAVERWEERFSLGVHNREVMAAYNRAEYVGNALDGCLRLVDRGSRAEFRIKPDKRYDNQWVVVTIVWYSGDFDSVKGDADGCRSVVASDASNVA